MQLLQLPLVTKNEYGDENKNHNPSLMFGVKERYTVMEAKITTPRSARGKQKSWPLSYASGSNFPTGN
jgi:hypothetical protein